MDSVIIAIGTSPNPLIRNTTEGLDTNNHGCIVTHGEGGETSRTHVYAGGDAVTGAATVILAMGVRSERPLISELCEEFGENVVLVGDADRPGQIYDALHSAYNRAFVFEA